MKFHHLQASIANNADQSPSLHMALCMVESLFLDMEAHCGTDISHVPVGDERLPSKLIWLCRVINEIYRDNSDELQRNRTRLDAAMGKLEATRKNLEGSADLSEQLSAVQAEVRTLEQELQVRQAAAAECEALTARCAQSRQQLEALRRFNPDEARSALEKLTADIAALEHAKSGLAAELAEKEHAAAQLRQETQALQKHADTLSTEIAGQKQLTARKQEEVSGLKSQREQAAKDLESLVTEGQQLVRAADEAETRIALYRDKIARFQESELAPKQAELAGIRAEAENLDKKLHALDQECDLLRTQRNKLILDISYKTTENETLNEKLALSRKNLSDLNQEHIRLNAALCTCLQELEALQAEVAQLNQQQLPEARSLREKEQQRRDELTASTQLLQAKCGELREEIRKLEVLAPKLEEEVRSERVVYDALTASCTASSKELENLERQIGELRSNNDGEKLVIYRKQLEERQQELKEIQAECARIELENAQAQKALEAGQNERARLQELKRRHTSGIEVTEKQLRELAFAGTNAYLQAVETLESRMKLLEGVRGKLAQSIANMRKTLGCAPIEESVSLEEQVKLQLRELLLRTDDLRCALVACANSINMEER